MQSLQFKPFSKEQLVEGLRKTFPQYKIQTSLGALQVRTSGFTITGNVLIKNDPKTGKVTTQTNLDMAIPYLFVLPPIGIYIFMKKDKAKKLEAEVVEGLNRILEPVG